jgi:hypothetical protein
MVGGTHARLHHRNGRSRTPAAERVFGRREPPILVTGKRASRHFAPGLSALVANRDARAGVTHS